MSQAGPRIGRAILSVSDKAGLASFARDLAAAGIELYSTGGTRAALEREGIAVLDIAAYTGFPEMMDGRVKTLHPKVHGGILCRHDRPDDLKSLADQGIVTFELVVVNLYPFEATVARADCTFDEAVEQIDIGGPSLVRAAAKNHAFVTIVTGPGQYAEVLEQVRAAGGTTPELRRRLAAAAYESTARYDRAIADWFARQIAPPDEEPKFPRALRLELTRREVLRYGENPHQRAALYAAAAGAGRTLVDARKLHGKELSYNNLLDLHAAWAIVRGLPRAAAAVIKHNNPCGAASAETLAEAALRALAGDPVSAFGSVLSFNRPVDEETAIVLTEPGQFIEAIVAPGYSEAALATLTTRPKWRDNVRLLAIDAGNDAAGWELRAIDGGFLVQDPDTAADPEGEWQVATKQLPSDAQLAELRFAWAVVRHVKSNAIVLCRDHALAGAGAGQMSRVDSVQIAIAKAGARARGSVLASDAFFPFDDSIHTAAAAGVAALIQPGGSRRDAEVIAACDQHGLAMVLTGRRHFKH
jgi:phosphoribosylaminoimidazolecarboxamide formyltransferase/IMP cyclohydrolase